MNISLVFVRILFALLCIFFMIAFEIRSDQQMTRQACLNGTIWGAGLAALFLSCDFFFRKLNLRIFNLIMVGIFIGYLVGQSINLIVSTLLMGSINSSIHLEMIKTFVFLISIYFGIFLTFKAADELYISIPFIRLTPKTQKKKDLLIDHTILADPRILDLAATGFLDRQLVVPRFLIKDLQCQSGSDEEIIRSRSRRSLEVLKRLETIAELDIRYHDTDFHEIKDPIVKLLRLARLVDANILTADVNRTQISTFEGVRFINIHSISNALKPLVQAGEYLKILIQRHGKESLQGVGYLEDGTMVVVNGGGDFIGETIKARVLSVKLTLSGRMIFCNAFNHDSADNFENDYEETYR